MAKSKSRRRKSPGSGTPAPSRGKSGLFGKVTPVKAGIGLVIAGLAVWAVVDYVDARQGSAAFNELVEHGRPALAKVERLPNDGREHVPDGTIIGYRDDLPTSGTHSLKWTDPGIYRTQQAPERLVHSLEHGMVVIYYDAPGEEGLKRLGLWASLFSGEWSGVVLTPKKGLGQAIVLTAWRRRLRLDAFEPATAAAFIDAYRGRGPENRVR